MLLVVKVALYTISLVLHFSCSHGHAFLPLQVSVSLLCDMFFLKMLALCQVIVASGHDLYEHDLYEQKIFFKLPRTTTTWFGTAHVIYVIIMHN